MKVLIVSSSFYPKNSPRAFRATELAKELVRQGHVVRVLTHRDDALHDAFEQEHGMVIKDLGQTRWNQLPIRRNSLLGLGARLFNRLSGLLLEYPNIQLMPLVKRALRRESGYDLLISIAVPYPVHWGVAAIRSKKHPIARCWVADCGDPYMGQENDSFQKPFYFRFVEQWFMRKADFVTVPTEGSIAGYYPEFHPKIKVIPQGFRFEEVEALQQPVNRAEKPIFAYAGLLIPGRRDPAELFEFLIDQECDYEFHIYTQSEYMVKPWLEKSGGRIVLHSFIPREELLAELSRMDFVVNFENVGSRQTPSKLIDYAILDKPILSVKTGELDTANVQRFIAGDYSAAFRVERVDQYRIENVVERFTNLPEVEQYEQ